MLHPTLVWRPESVESQFVALGNLRTAEVYRCRMQPEAKIHVLLLKSVPEKTSLRELIKATAPLVDVAGARYTQWQ